MPYNRQIAAAASLANFGDAEPPLDSIWKLKFMTDLRLYALALGNADLLCCEKSNEKGEIKGDERTPEG